MVTGQEPKTELLLAHFLFPTNSDNSVRNDSKFQDTCNRQPHTNTYHQIAHDSLTLQWAGHCGPGPKEQGASRMMAPPTGQGFRVCGQAWLPLLGAEAIA